MKARLLQPGDLLIDYSGARPHMPSVVQAGARGIIRYSAGMGNMDSATSFKLCGRTEIHDALAAGLDFVANSEWYETRVTEGEAMGRADGGSDLIFWKARQLAHGSHIYYSWDSAPLRSEWDKVYAYLSGAHEALDGIYTADIYAGTPFIEYLQRRGLPVHGQHRTKPKGWRPNAGSWSNDGLPYQPKTTTTRQRAALVKLAAGKTSAAIYQTGNYWFSNGADEDLVLSVPIGSHLDAVTGRTGGGGHHKPPPPKPGPGPKPDQHHPGTYFQKSADGTSYTALGDDGKLRIHTPDGEYVVTTRKAQS